MRSRLAMATSLLRWMTIGPNYDSRPGGAQSFERIWWKIALYPQFGRHPPTPLGSEGGYDFVDKCDFLMKVY